MNKINLSVFASVVFLLFLAWGPLVSGALSLTVGTVDQLPNYLINKGLFAVLILVLMVRYRGWRFFGLHAGQGWRFLMPSLPIFLLTVLVLLNPDAAFGLGAAATIGWIVASLAIGIGEEAVFRGVLWRAFDGKGLAFKVLVSSALFGAVHLMGLVAGFGWQIVFSQVVFAFGMGVTFAAIRHASGSLVAPIALHAIFDAGAIVAAGGINEMLNEGVQPLQMLVPGLFFLAWGGGCLWFMNRRTPEGEQAAEAR